MWILSDETPDAISVKNSGEGGVWSEPKPKKFELPIPVK